jgi:hypothetical protein
MCPAQAIHWYRSLGCLRPRNRYDEWPVGAENPIREPHPGSSRRHPILVDKTAELVRASQSRRIGTTERRARPLQSERSALGKGAVRPMLVVVRDELTKNYLELTTVNHEQSVKTLPASHGADEPLGERVCPRRPGRGADHLDAFGAKFLVDARRELGVAVSDHELDRAHSLRKDDAQVAGLAGDPLPCWLRRNAGHVYPLGVELDEEQHIETFEHDGVDGEEVRRKRWCSLGAEIEYRPEASVWQGRIRPRGIEGSTWRSMMTSMASSSRSSRRSRSNWRMRTNAAYKKDSATDAFLVYRHSTTKVQAEGVDEDFGTHRVVL